jgi:hypothetical protein
VLAAAKRGVALPVLRAGVTEASNGLAAMQHRG